KTDVVWYSSASQLQGMKRKKHDHRRKRRPLPRMQRTRGCFPKRHEPHPALPADVRDARLVDTDLDTHQHQVRRLAVRKMREQKGGGREVIEANRGLQ